VGVSFGGGVCVCVRGKRDGVEDIVDDVKHFCL
jgi:hypothetical protein